MRILLILVAVLITATSATEAEQRNQKATENQTKTQKYHSGTEQRPVFVKIVPTQKSAEESKTEKEERDKKILNENLLTWSTVFLAVVTAILAAFTAFLWNATRKLVAGANDTAERQLRAYINIAEGKVTNFIDPENRTFHIVFKNFGQTPAHNVSIVAECAVREHPFNKEIPLTKITSSDHSVFSILGPTCGYGQEFPVPTNYEWEPKIIDGSAAVYCYGEIRYIDAFDKPRVTKFRYMCGDGATEGNVRPCEEGNSAT